MTERLVDWSFLRSRSSDDRSDALLAYSCTAKCEGDIIEALAIIALTDQWPKVSVVFKCSPFSCSHFPGSQLLTYYTIDIWIMNMILIQGLQLRDFIRKRITEPHREHAKKYFSLYVQTNTGWRKKRGHPISLQIFWKCHDRIAWKLVNICNIICWTQSLTFCLKISSRCLNKLVICSNK